MKTNNQTMTVEQFVMLLTAQSIISTANSGQKDPYKYCSPIHRIYCNDGTSLSVQAHGGVHCAFLNIERDSIGYSKEFGTKLTRCETDSPDLNKYGSDSIEDIEKYVESHGGIDIQTTMEKAVKHAIAICYNSKHS